MANDPREGIDDIAFDSGIDSDGARGIDPNGNPMKELASALGRVVYPPDRSDVRLRIGLMVAPCGLLVVLSMIWQAGAPFLLTLAGAFASIQLSDPYKVWVANFHDHLERARDHNLSWARWARVRLSYYMTPLAGQVIFGRHRDDAFQVGLRSVGYSPAGRARAQRRFRKLSRRWQRSFMDISGRVMLPGASAPEGPAALPRWHYPVDSPFDYWQFVRRGRIFRNHLIRGILGGIPMILIWILSRVHRSGFYKRVQEIRCERILRRIGYELIRATADEGADAPVSTLAEQVRLTYVRPRIKPKWVFFDPPRSNDDVARAVDSN